MGIRRATSEDIAAVTAFGQDVVPSHYEPILGKAAAQGQLAWWSAERLGPAIDAGRVHLATADGIVGVVETGELGGEQVVWKLYVASDRRGTGLGPELLRHAIRGLPDGTDHVVLEHFAGNTRAGHFYAREGFEVVRTEPAATGDSNADIVWRRLDLTGRSRDDHDPVVT